MTVSVADDGPGIPADVGDRVFERLYTGRDGPGRAIGTGLGLTIVRELSVALPKAFDDEAFELCGDAW